ncbi:MAG TPA: DUF4037 domain-containing protein [Anaerolineales bacterium]|nr:DUF4037 domain-containing protein [Anaerolineales bacterium]
MEFIPSLELSRMLYEEEIAPCIAKKFPDLKYAAATLGMCSEILGLDDAVSMDHEWGPRITIFLAEEDQALYSQEIAAVLRESLPPQFKGFTMMWRQSGIDVHDTRETILYHVGTSTVDRALRFCGGTAAAPLQAVDWLNVSDQHLLEFTAGVVYRDDTGDLTRARKMLAYYPDDVLCFLLMCDWNAVGGDWFPIGRIGSKGDALGLRLQVAKIAQSMMRLAFMVSRKYMPYKKWFGLLFKRLPIAASLEPALLDLLQETDWRKAEEKIGAAAAILLQQQNQLGIAPEMPLDAKVVDAGRHYIQVDFWEIGRQLTKDLPPALKAVLDNQVFWLDERNLILWNGEVGKWTLLLQK